MGKFYFIALVCDLTRNIQVIIEAEKGIKPEHLIL